MKRSVVAAAAVASLIALSAVARASVPTVAELDAASRSAGNRIDIAEAIGRSVFSTEWPAQVSQISANEIGKHVIVGIRLWGVKFHHQLTRAEFAVEVATLTERAFTAAPSVEEVDVWASVPIAVGKGVVVSGDLAKPTSRTVFSLSVRRGETGASIEARAMRGPGAFWDEEWATTAFQKQGG